MNRKAVLLAYSAAALAAAVGPLRKADAPSIEDRPEDRPPHVRDAVIARENERLRLAQQRRARKAERLSKGMS